MKRVGLLVVLIGTMAVAFAYSAARSQDKEPGKPGGPPDTKAMEEAWMKAAMPGPEHKQLEYMVGTWDVEVKMWNMPGGEPETSRGRSTGEWVLGGRFVGYRYKGEFHGGPFEGIGYTGYDNIQKKYLSIWMDTMYTGALIDWGAYDTASRTFSYAGEFKAPTGQTVQSRSVVKVVNNDEHMITMYHSAPGTPEQKVMELTYRRAAGGEKRTPTR